MLLFKFCLGLDIVSMQTIESGNYILSNRLDNSICCPELSISCAACEVLRVKVVLGYCQLYLDIPSERGGDQLAPLS